jgi:hypothetical protein
MINTYVKFCLMAVQALDRRGEAEYGHQHSGHTQLREKDAVDLTDKPSPDDLVREGAPKALRQGGDVRVAPFFGAGQGAALFTLLGGHYVFLSDSKSEGIFSNG